ncbi:polyunsaturated fatty acid lipoxygenase ALOX15B-like isoform X2 [Eleginops maclovinus]|uniref:polyunsaturated fatty acid lipoxygenase ALOX15B-like isoform X2 n=1 Tax=Eleginops maclovinus TaxID=56733 RepID=UPI003080E4E3
MAEYNLKVTTGSMLHAGTFDNLYVTLIGTERQSERIQLTSFGLDDTTGKVGTFAVTTLFTLGCLLFLKLEHDSLEKDWFCSTLVVTTPEVGEIIFPCHRWLSRGEFVLLRGGRATKAFEDVHPKLVDQRKKELVQQKIIYKWASYAEGLPYILNSKDANGLPAESRLSFSRAFEIGNTRKEINAELKLKGLTDSYEQFESFEALKMTSLVKKTPLAEYVSEHWKDDDFFGYQFLNGVNPVIIQRCSKLPSNFPVTEEMVKPFLAIGSSLNAEMTKGNIFLSDYKIMEGLPTTVIDGKPTVLTPALCLLYLNPEKKLLPIAIQLSQQHSGENPIFLPTDSKSDWLLAKLFVRSADTLHHLLVSHLLKTHLLPEVFTMATFRNLPKNHPLYKSTLAEEGQVELLRRGLSRMTYSSLCLPKNIAARGLESIPNFHFRDDALRLWSIINSFIKSLVAYYYPSDSEVSADSELQEWLNEIFYYGFLGNYDSGFPSSLQTVEELIQVVTTVVFTSSVLHSAGNRGQFDYLGWSPNGPLILHKAPPTTKGQSSMEDILAYLPKKSTSIIVMSYAWLFRGNFSDFVPLGIYPEQSFAEPAALQMIKDFQAELSSLSVAITKRNSKLELPFNYLNPKEIENSPAI